MVGEVLRFVSGQRFCHGLGCLQLAMDRPLEGWNIVVEPGMGGRGLEPRVQLLLGPRTTRTGPGCLPRERD